MKRLISLCITAAVAASLCACGSKQDTAATNGTNGEAPVYGARPLKRYLQKHVETLAAKIILGDEVRAGNTIVIDVAENGNQLIAYPE